MSSKPGNVTENALKVYGISLRAVGKIPKMKSVQSIDVCCKSGYNACVIKFMKDEIINTDDA